MSIFLGDIPLTGGGTVDQTYDATSTNAQSGTAVAGLLETLYPVGSVYITTAASCPLSALISGSTWTLKSSGRVLQGADSGHSAGTTIKAGLPNITGSTSAFICENGTGAAATASGAFSVTVKDSSTASSGTGNKSYEISLNASSSNSIYGNSSTVQPPAYVVNIWERTA